MARIDYDRIARDYDAARGMSEEGLAAWRDALSHHLPPPTGLPVLDLGCGTGSWASAIARWFDLRVVAVDQSRGMLSQAIAKPPASLIAHVIGDAQRLPLRDARAGAVWISTVIHHVPDLSACAREVRRVLAPGGPLLIRSAFAGRLEGISFFRYFPEAERIAETFPSVEATVETFAAAGFEFQSLQSVPQLTAPDLAGLCERVALRADTTLQGISDEAFERGLAALHRAAAETPPSPIISRLDLLVLR